MKTFALKDLEALGLVSFCANYLSQSWEEEKRDYYGTVEYIVRHRKVVRDFWLFDDVIVFVEEYFRFRDGHKPGGMGCEIRIEAIRTRTSESGQHPGEEIVSHRSMDEVRNDPQGPVPKDMEFVAWENPPRYPEQSWLKLMGTMPNGEKKEYSFCFRRR